MKFQKILIAVDDSAHSEKAAQAGLQLAKKINAEVAFVYVVDAMVNTGAYDVVMMPVIITMPEEISVRKKEAEKTLELLSSKLGRKATHFIPEGIPREEIIAIAEQWSADIIVMGTHGHTGFTHLILGSVAEYVVRHSKIPVMVVPLKKN